MIRPADILQGNYNSKLNDDRWKARRREVLANQRFCSSCKRGNIVLQVHHNFHDKDRDPWDYEDRHLRVLCKDCHQRFHDALLSFRRDVLPYITVRSMEVLTGSLKVGHQFCDPLYLAYAVAFLASHPETVKRFALSFNKNADAER